MSDQHTARSSEAPPSQPVVDDEESVVAEHQLRPPSLQRLGRYRLVREIASGGMATVNLAVAEGLDKLVALKIIHPHLAQEESFVRMFLDEARLASSISHRNVCNVFDFGECDGRFYIAMDYLSGQSLRDVLRRMRKTDLQMEPLRVAAYVAYMVAEACEGLHAAHELHGPDGKPLNVVHRDVSPHNLFVTYDGNVSVVDFGIARASDRVQSTATGVLKGKFSYMAPEQMRQLDVDRRSDIWALGVVLWESLTLQRLFVRASQADTVMSVMMDRLRPPSEVRVDLPKELDQITMRAIARNPAHRFSTAREMGRDLMKFCRESGVLVGPIEIEHFMSRLFAKEIDESKQLVRRAKQSSQESGVWMDMTPSGFARTSMRTGSFSAAPPTMPSFTHSSAAARLTGSHAAPTTEARRTALPSGHKVKRVALATLLCTAAVAAGAWLAIMQRNPDRIARIDQLTKPTSSLPGSTIQPPPPMLDEVEAPTLQQAPDGLPAGREMPAEAAVAPEPSTPAAAPTLHGDARVPTGRPRTPPAAGRSNSQQPSSVATNPYATHAPSEPAARTEAAPARTEPVTSSAPLHEPERVPERVPEQVAVAPAAVPATPSAAPAPVAVQPVAVAPTPPPKPAAPQKLAAEAAIAELEVDGSLGKGTVSRMLARLTPALRTCYATAAKSAGRNDFTSLPMTFVIDEVGSVRTVSAGKHPLPELPGCASVALKRMRSERVPDVGVSTVRFTVGFTP